MYEYTHTHTHDGAWPSAAATEGLELSDLIVLVGGGAHLSFSGGTMTAGSEKAKS